MDNKFSKTFLSQTKKNPTLQKHFLHIWENDLNCFFKEMDILRIFLKIKKYNNLIKNNKFDIISQDSFEIIEDNVDAFVQLNKIEKLKKSLFSNKYKHLCNVETDYIISSCIDNNIDKHIINNYLKKIASFTESEQLNQALNTCFEENTVFGIQEILNKIKKHKLDVDITYISHQEKILILKINNYKASSILGSSNWCISYSPTYFLNYTLKMSKGSKGMPASQFFIFDFNLPVYDKMSLIGVTMTDKKIIFAADKNDRSLFKPLYNKFVSKTFDLNKEKYFNDNYFVLNVMKKLKGNDFNSFEYLKKYLSTINFNFVEDEVIIQLSQFMDHTFKSKALKRSSKRLLGKIILDYDIHKKSANVMSLVKNKLPNLQKKIQYLSQS